ncbi:MAG: UbiD family decarboxylase [Mycobacterium leprae]
MAYRDFRQFLQALKDRGDLMEVNTPIALDEVGKALKQVYAKNGPAVIFNNTGAKHPLVAGIYGNREKALLAFEATNDNIFDKMLYGLDHPQAPVVVSAAEAPCQEVVLTGDQIDITEFPIPTYSPDDGGPFITAGITVSKDPETGIPDMGHYRYQVFGKNKLSFLAQPFHRYGKHLNKARQMGRTSFEAALVLGVDPVLAYTCQVQVSDTTDDFAVAGGLRGEPVELVKCKTIDLEVPATAEVVIEFKVDFGEQVFEGPLGEYTGYYTPGSDKPVATITAITHRRNPYMQGLLTGKPVTENHILKEMPFEASLYRQLKAQFPTITKVAVPPSGGVSFYTVIAMKPRYAGEARHVALAAMSTNVRPKYVIVVEPDIDVFNSAEVEWALSFRSQPGNDAIIVDNLPAGPLDPSVGESKALAARTMSAIGIDATRPFGEPFSKVADVPGWQEFHLPELEKWRR